MLSADDARKNTNQYQSKETVETLLERTELFIKTNSERGDSHAWLTAEPGTSQEIIDQVIDILKTNGYTVEEAQDQYKISW